MKCVILAGGRGTRLSEETQSKPKPMVEVGGFPILWHIMKIYTAHGITDFVICLGYKGSLIKNYFLNYSERFADITIDIEQRNVEYHERRSDPWKITLVDTGMDTQTGGRLKRVAKYLEGEEAFCFTYGDGVGDIDVSTEIAFHQEHKCDATMTLVYPQARFGAAHTDEQTHLVKKFNEKPIRGEGMINGGFFVLSPKILDLLDGDEASFEKDALPKLVDAKQLMAWKHDGFWKPMDTLRDKEELEGMWQTNQAKWKIWK